MDQLAKIKQYEHIDSFLFQIEGANYSIYVLIARQLRTNGKLSLKLRQSSGGKSGRFVVKNGNYQGGASQNSRSLPPQ